MNRERDRDQADDDATEPGASIGREPADASASAASGDGDPLRVDQPDEGWQDWPEGHRQGPSADDDHLRRKG